MRSILILAVIVIENLYFVHPYDLTLLHINDIHVRMDETNKYSSACKEQDSRAGKCYGGVSRIHGLVKSYRSTPGNTLWVNAGDFFQGTIFYTQFKWRIVSQFNNRLEFDAITLGNHEFDDRIVGLVPFLKEQKSPVIVTNLNHTLVPEMEGLYKKSIVKEIGGRKVGIVGYLTPDTTQISNPEKMIFMDEIQSLKQEVDKLHRDGIDIIIALGHSGYTKDLEVAREVPHIDVVVGGHSHSFLYAETEKKRNPSNNDIKGPYPTVVHSSVGGKVLVVQAYAFSKYLGKVDLTFSETGDLETWSGDPILLDSSVQKDLEIEKELEPWRLQLAESTNIVVGQSQMVMDISRERESYLGNLLTDMLVWAWSNKTFSGEKVRLAILHSGGIRASLDKGNITKGDVMTVLPFGNTLDLVTLSGATILKVMEFSVAKVPASGQYSGGEYLQYSGFKVTYDLRMPGGRRVERALALEADGQYVPLQEDKLYRVVVSNYMVTGGDGYKMIEEEKKEHLQGMLDIDIFEAYLSIKSPITTQYGERITMKTVATAETTLSYSSTERSWGSEGTTASSGFDVVAGSLLYPTILEFILMIVL